MENEKLGFNDYYKTIIRIDEEPYEALKKISLAFKISDIDLKSQNETLCKRLFDDEIKVMVRDTGYIFRSMILRQRLGIKKISQIETGL